MLLLARFDHIDREELQRLSRQTGIRLEELVALSSERDPFLAGTPTQATDARKFVALVTRANIPPDTHLRDVHYKLLHAEVGYDDPDDEWLKQASRAARDLGLVEPWAFPDRRTRLLVSDGRGDGDEIEYVITKPSLSIPTASFQRKTRIKRKGEIDGRFDPLLHQPVRVIVLMEKDSDDLRGETYWPCRDAGVELRVTTGFSPKTLAARLAKEALEDDRPLVVFLITDADFDGDHMPTVTARHLEFLASRYALPPIYVSDIALSLEQVTEIEAEIGRRIPRADDRIRGGGRVELNALAIYAPGWLRARVEEALAEVTVEIAAPEAEVPEELADFIDKGERLADRLLGRVRNRLELIDQIVADASEAWEPGAVEIEVPEPMMRRDWVLDPELDYREQLNVYRARKGLGPLDFTPRTCALPGCENTMGHRPVQARYCSLEHTREADRLRRRGA